MTEEPTGKKLFRAPPPVTRPEPGTHEPWQLLGFLRARLEFQGRLYATDWEEALDICVQQAPAPSREPLADTETN